jgi:hypothetical protein
VISSLRLSAALLASALPMYVGLASAHTQRTIVQASGSAPRVAAVASPVNPYQKLNIWANPTYTGGGDGYQDNGKNKYKGKYKDKDKDREKDKDKDQDKDKDKYGPSPVPEPSTIQSFGAALLIGAGVLYSRRLRRNRR